MLRGSMKGQASLILPLLIICQERCVLTRARRIARLSPPGRPETSRHVQDNLGAITTLYTDSGMAAFKPTRLSRSPGPQSVAMCLVVRDQDIREWINHHTSLGVQRIYVYDDESRVPLLGNLMDDIKLGTVHYNFTFRAPGEQTVQVSRYNDCLNSFGNLHEWMAFIDADEFIMVVDRMFQNDLPGFLNQYRMYGGLGVNWRIFGSGGHIAWPRRGNADQGIPSAASTLRAYTKCTPSDYHLNNHVKSIVQPKHVSAVVNPHYVEYKEGYHAVAEDFRELDYEFNFRPRYQKIVCNHYFTKSWSEWVGKLRRGNANQPSSEAMWYNRFMEIQKAAVEDCPYNQTRQNHSDHLGPASASWVSIVR